MIRVGKAIGGNTDFLTAQAFVFPKNISEEVPQDLYLAIIIEAEGEDIFTKVRGEAPFIEETFSEVDLPIPQKITKLTDSLKNKLSDAQNLQIIIALFKENVLYLKSEGQAKALLLRDGQTLDLLQKQEEGQLISGYLKEEDKIILLNSSQIDQTDLEQLLTSHPDNLEEEITLLVQKNPANPYASVLIQNLKQDDGQEESSENLESLDTRKIPPILINLRIILAKFTRRIKRARLLLTGITLLLLLSLGSYYAYQNFFVNKQTPQASETGNLQPGISSDVHQITDWPLFLSLDLIKKDFDSKRLSFSLGKVLLLNESDKSLVSLDLETKQNTILAGRQQLGEAKYSSLNGSNAFVYSDDKGITRIEIETQKLLSVSTKDEEWGNIADIFGFGTNLYALDSSKNQIWKYVPIESGYAGKTHYIKEGQNVDLSGARRLQIDYSVWVLKGGPEIFRFTGGSLDNFSVGGLDKPLQDLNNFFVGEGEGPGDENSFAYFLDSQNSRLVVLKKNGQYHSQYIGDKFKTASDFVVDEANKKVYLLEGGKIYQIELK